jgi:hypothetical protein
MIHPYHAYPLAKLRHEEALKEARVRHLKHRAKAYSKPHSEEQGLWSRLGKLAAAVGLS